MSKDNAMALPFERDGNGGLIDSHEDRLQQLERGTSEILASLATNTEKTENLSQRLTDGFAGINEKIETCVLPMAQKLDNHLEDDAKVHSVVDELQEERKKRSERMATIKKVSGAIAIAALGALAKTLFTMLFHLKG